MTYEIINPSDECYITTDNILVAKYCTLLLGYGRYSLRDENNKCCGDLYLFGVDKETLDKDFEGDFNQFAINHQKEIVACFESFKYAYPSSSVNDIGKRAEYYANYYRDCAGISPKSAK